MPTINCPRVSQDLRSAAFVQNPYSCYSSWRPSPAVYWQQYNLVCFLSYERVDALLRDKRFGRQILHLRSREQLGWEAPPDHLRAFNDFERNSMLELEGAQHTRLRRLVGKSFVSRQIAALEPLLIAWAHELIDAFPTNGAFDILPGFAQVIPVRAICHLLGAPIADAQTLLDWSHAMVAMYQARRDRSVEDAAVAATQDFSAYLSELLADAASLPPDTLLAQLREQHRAGLLSKAELISTAILLLNAGHEATVHSLANGIKTLLQHYSADALAPALLAAPEAHVEEILRFDPPLHLFTRYALEEVELPEVHLQPGEQIGLLLAAANRDPARYRDPDAFQPQRPPQQHLGFGAGVHFCLGTPLARLELSCALQALCQRRPRLRLADQARYQDSFHFHGLESLMVE